MSDTPEITGVIRNARFFDIGKRQICAGNLYEDKRGRWPDGASITTSEVVDVKGDIIYTKNSIYRIERRAA